MKEKLIILLCAAVAVVTVAKAQEAVAVLTHSGTSKTFSGYTALQEAYAEAVSGDLITLSSGTFGAVTTIEKAITIRGAGMEVDTVYQTMPTILSGNFQLNITNNGGSRFCLEGIYSNATISYSGNQNPEFVKCRLNTITEADGTLAHASFFHCRICGRLSIAANSQLSLLNCFVYKPTSIDDETSVANYTNCIIVGASSYGSGYDRLHGCTLTNCVLTNTVGVSSAGYIEYNDKTSFQNCLIQSSIRPDDSKNTYTNFSNSSDVFKTFQGYYSDAEDFELTAGYNSQYGIYSGSFPYSPRVTGPHIEQMEVAPRTTEAGMLNVKIKVTNSNE